MSRTLPSVAAIAVVAAVALAPSVAAAQTPFIPYYGKNQIRYDTFRWRIYTTDHFEIYYYPEIEQHLERVAAYAESAYQHISSELKYDLAFKIPLILFKTSSEFQQQNVIPGAAQEGVGAFAEPTRYRIVMPLDEPPDLLYRLIVHELTHQFEFDIIPTSLIRRSVPLWVNEGLSDYMTGIWRPIDLMTVRDAAVADIIPKMTNLEGYTATGSIRMIYNLGHAVFEFIESRWGKEGIRQYLFSLRKSVIGGGEDAYQEAFRLTPEEFDQEFDKYLKDRFKPFRDKERPADYGRNLAPDPEETPFIGAVSIEPSPSGDLIAMVTGNRRDREMDIVLVSARDGSIIRNLTNNFDQDRGFEFIIQPGMRFNTVPWLSWSPSGDRIAYFVRREKWRTLILQNVLTRDVEERIELRTVDDPESPDISPDGTRVAFAALQGGVGDIFLVDLRSREVTNLTKDAFADSGPTWSPDGRSIVYVARISGNEKLFRLDVATGQKTQLTFGTHDDSAAQFLDNDTLVFSSTATDPNQPIEPEVARNGNIYNVWTLSLKTGELRQYTDALGGNTSAVVLRGDPKQEPRIAFVSYYKGEYELHVLDRREPIVTAASSDFGAPGPIIDFQAPLSHTLIADNKRRKGTFEKMFIDGRPPVNVGVTSGGDVFGGSAVTFSDVLGDKQFTLYAASISQYRTLAFSFFNAARRFNFSLQGFSQTSFFYGALEGVFYDPIFSPLFLDRDLAVATRTVRGGTAFGIWPIDRYRRVELFGGVLQYREEFNDPSLEAYSQEFQQQQFGRQLFRSGTYLPLGVNFVQETTVFREFGPLAGNTMRLSYEVAPGIGDALGRQTADVDARYYLRLGGTGLLALRAKGFKSWGDAPDFTYFGGNSEMRGYEYLEFIGSEATFLNAELRFPFIEAMLTPIGILGGIRGVFFANMGGARFEGQPFKWLSTKSELYTPVVGFNQSFLGQLTPVFGPPTRVDGLRLVDARASYGIGLETFALGFPIHFDWAWRTLFNRDWEDLRFAAVGGSSAFRKARFAMWIGYDF
ncbi:MAG: PD40 domain-containing protein [Acidobacteria bacterium]|nr:PD40 domain-containing protein [Acidobacteriota bacterium]